MLFRSDEDLGEDFREALAKEEDAKENKPADSQGSGSEPTLPQQEGGSNSENLAGGKNVTGVIFSPSVRKAIKEAKEEIALLRMRKSFDKFSRLTDSGLDQQEVRRLDIESPPCPSLGLVDVVSVEATDGYELVNPKRKVTM